MFVTKKEYERDMARQREANKHLLNHIDRLIAKVEALHGDVFVLKNNARQESQDLNRTKEECDRLRAGMFKWT